MEPQSASSLHIEGRPSTSDQAINITRNRPRFSFKSFTSSSRFLLLALCYMSIFSCRRSHAFSSAAIQRSNQRNNIDTSSPSHRSGSFFMSSIAEVSSEIPAENSYEPNATPRLSDFQKRMKGMMKRNGIAQKKEAMKPANLKTVHTLLEYKKELEENSDKIVVVRFFATWCKVRAFISRGIAAYG